jgi:spore coat polysaccharide biosynthesis protein SpsF
MSVLTILQARMSSSRLPGKVLKPLLGEPMIGRQIERLRRSRHLGRLVVATSTEPSDQPLAVYCASIGVEAFRGPLDDVLGRFGQALAAFEPAEHVVRLTADCPLADWEVIDAVIDLHLKSGADYTSNALERTYPKGLDVEVMTAEALRAACAEAQDPYEREHVTPFLYRHPERFRLVQLTQPEKLDQLRWTVDTPEDFEFVTRVYEALHPADNAFTSADILALPWGRWCG